MQWQVTFDLRVNLSDEELLRNIYRAAAISEVTQQIPLKPAVRLRLNRLNIIRAVQGTTGIEGSDLSEEEVERVLDAPEGKPVLLPSRRRQEIEARNAARVMSFVARTLEEQSDRPVSEGLIQRIHELTTEEIDYPTNQPGHYRNHGVAAADYVPPREPQEVRRLMAEFVKWVNEPPASKWHPILRAVAAHFYLISIHPFGDGNGRTARAVESYLLYQGNVNQLGFYSLANFYYRERSKYIEMLDYTRFGSGDDLTAWLKFATRGLVGELELVQKEVLDANRQVAFRDFSTDVLWKLNGVHAKVRGRLVTFMELLHFAGGLDESEIRSPRGPLSGIYPPPAGGRTLTRDLNLLEKEQLISRRDGRILPNVAVMDQFTRPVFHSLDDTVPGPRG